MRSGGEAQLVSVDFRGSAEELWHTAQIFSGSGGVLANAASAPTSLRFLAFDLESSATGQTVLSTAIVRAAEQVEHLRQRAAQVERTRRSFEGELSEALAQTSTAERPADSGPAA